MESKRKNFFISYVLNVLIKIKKDFHMNESLLIKGVYCV